MRLHSLLNATLAVAGAAVFGLLLGAGGYALDTKDELSRDMRAAAECREKHGESLLTHDANGQPVCVPRGYIKH